MDNAVAGLNIGSNNVGVVHHGLAVGKRELHVFALDGGGFQAIAQVARQNLAGDHVIEQDLLQCALGIREECVDRAGRQLGKRFVGGGKDGEGTIALERVDQTGGLDGSHQRAEVTGRDGGIDDVGRLVLGEGGSRAAARRPRPAPAEGETESAASLS